MPLSTNVSNLSPVFSGLRSILVPYSKMFAIQEDTANYYCLETREPVKKGKPGFFAAVRKGGASVSFHLMGAAMHRELLKGISPALRKRLEGKSTFNFTKVDQALFAELARLTAASSHTFKATMPSVT